jgi:glycosyltransferase involved in cell wall biosynthesis
METAGRSVVHVAPSRIPGRAANAFQVFKMAEAFVSLGFRTHLFAGATAQAAPTEEELRRLYGVARLPDLRLMPIRGRFGIHLFNLRVALAASRLKPDAVVSRSVGAAAICASFGLPTVWECHAPPHGVERLYWRRLRRSRGFRRVAVISAALAQLMEDIHPETKCLDVVVAHDGVDVARYAHIPSPDAAKAAAGLPPSQPVAAYAGHLYEGRGIGLILDCAAALPHWRFRIAGGTEADLRTTADVIARRSLGNVDLLGFIENAALPETLAAADVLLMPYQRRVMVSGGRLDTARWMSPLKMFEYLAMGRAIVSSDLPVLREVLTDANALLADPDDAGAWITALRRLEDGALRVRLSDDARETARRYDWRRRAEIMLAGL